MYRNCYCHYDMNLSFNAILNSVPKIIGVEPDMYKSKLFHLSTPEKGVLYCDSDSP